MTKVSEALRKTFGFIAEPLATYNAAQSLCESESDNRGLHRRTRLRSHNSYCRTDDPSGTTPTHVSVNRGKDCTIDPTADLGNGVILGDKVTIQAGVIICPGAIIGEGVTIESGAVIGPHAKIGDFSQIMARAEVGSYAQLSSCVVIGRKAKAGRHCAIGFKGRLEDGVTIMAGELVGEYETIDQAAAIKINSSCSFGA